MSEHRRAKQRANRFRRTYGASLAFLQLLLHKQNDRCGICARPWQECRPAKIARYDRGGFFNHVYVDHDHATGKIRGLLCHACNTAIGLFDDRIDWLLSAVRYLEEFGEERLDRSAVTATIAKQPAQMRFTLIS
ncbi:MAG: endonuclease VII domain-containing protein [Candidatus Eremiobacteraeota bacterium]|nr:endonuclease VII domain-containing protein [Candidatus Eremiobacteraeota bacterium]